MVVVENSGPVDADGEAVRSRIAVGVGDLDGEVELLVGRWLRLNQAEPADIEGIVVVTVNAIRVADVLDLDAVVGSTRRPRHLVAAAQAADNQVAVDDRPDRSCSALNDFVDDRERRDGDVRIASEPVDKIHPRFRGGGEGRDLDGDGSFWRIRLVDGKGRRGCIKDIVEGDIGFDIGLVLVQIWHEEVRVRARDVGDECTLIGVDLVAVDAERGGAAGLTDIEHVLGDYVPALGLIQWILPDHHDLGGVRIAEGHEEVAAGWRSGEVELQLRGRRSLKDIEGVIAARQGQPEEIDVARGPCATVINILEVGDDRVVVRNVSEQRHLRDCAIQYRQGRRGARDAVGCRVIGPDHPAERLEPGCLPAAKFTSPSAMGPMAGPSSWNCTASPMPVEFVALSPSPSVTVTTASNAPSVIDTESSGLAAFGCFSEAYCAVLTTPLVLLIATAKAAAPVAPPMRPTTRSPSLNRKMLVPSVVSRPESTPAADTASENAVVPPS